MLSFLLRQQYSYHCYCNYGCCCVYPAFLLVSAVKAGHVCWDDKDILEGLPTGALRVSLGWMSTWEDVHVSVL